MVRFSPQPNKAHLVHWREWGETAFAEAREQDKPVVLFITAFWCGVCHRLDETSLSRDEVIALLNAFFVPVRVEDGQRPDLDLRYNQSGVPTIVFLTPQGDHLFSVNYLEPKQMLDLLVRVVDTWQKDRAAIVAASVGATAAPPSEKEPPRPLGPEIVAEVAGMLEGLADHEHGGFGTEAKFFHTEATDFLLYLYATTGERAYLDHACLTLDRMRASRTFDAMKGGFYRYSSRRDWQEPHPEKLLDDQAALLGNYLHAYLLAGAQPYRETAESLVDYLDATLFDASTGVFRGCQDYLRPKLEPGVRGPAPLVPYIDPYVYCDANARAASVYLDAWWLLGRGDCRTKALGVLDWLWANLRTTDGGMHHYFDGASHTPGLLTDAVMAGSAFLKAYALLDDATALDRARQLADYVLERHRNPAGAFYDIRDTGPAALRFPLTVLTQNAAAAAFLTRLADLSGDGRYREEARRALASFPNSHRSYGAYAAGFGHAVSLLLAQPLVLTLTAAPGDERGRGLVGAALTQLRPQNPVLRYRVVSAGVEALIELGIGGRTVGPIRDAALLRPEVLVGSGEASSR